MNERENMRIVNIFDAAKEGNFEALQKFYNGNINQINEFTGLNLLQSTLISSNNIDERLKIVDFLLNKGIDVNYSDKKYQRNALHILFFNFLRGDVEYLTNVVGKLINAEINVNALDKYNATPLKYAITICKLKTEELRTVYIGMIRAGADYNLKDIFGKSCIDYAKELAWRTEFIEIVEEVLYD